MPEGRECRMWVLDPMNWMLRERYDVLHEPEFKIPVPLMHQGFPRQSPCPGFLGNRWIWRERKKGVPRARMQERYVGSPVMSQPGGPALQCQAPMIPEESFLQNLQMQYPGLHWWHCLCRVRHLRRWMPSWTAVLQPPPMCSPAYNMHILHMCDHMCENWYSFSQAPPCALTSACWRPDLWDKLVTALDVA